MPKTIQPDPKTPPQLDDEWQLAVEVLRGLPSQRLHESVVVSADGSFRVRVADTRRPRRNAERTGRFEAPDLDAVVVASENALRRLPGRDDARLVPGSTVGVVSRLIDGRKQERFFAAELDHDTKRYGRFIDDTLLIAGELERPGVDDGTRGGASERGGAIRGGPQRAVVEVLRRHVRRLDRAEAHKLAGDLVTRLRSAGKSDGS